VTILPLLLAIASQGPVLDLPPEDPAEHASSSTEQKKDDDEPALRLPAGVGLQRDVADNELLRGLQDARLRSGRTLVGGYGQINGSASSVGPGPNGEMLNTPVYTANVRRLVLFVSHSFAEDLHVYTELEWENAVACRTCVGAVEIEQAFVEWSLVKNRSRDLLALRGGLVLIPIGILNQWHEPPVFHGVERARMEEGGIVPSTWRELGAGVVGEPLPGWRYEAYVSTSLDPTRLRDSGLTAARTNGALAPAQTMQLSVRTELEPFLGFLVGVSGIAGDLGGATLGARPFFDVNGKPLPLTLPMYAFGADARVRKNGFEARSLVTGFFFPNAGDLMQARTADGSLLFPVEKGGKGALPTRMLGAEIEAAYDVLRLFPVDTEQQLLPFLRLEFYNGQSAVPDGYVPDPFYDVKEATLGVSYRPIQQVVIKADVQARNRRLGFDEAQANVGLGFMF
jgi:hypothetical protein